MTKRRLLGVLALACCVVEVVVTATVGHAAAAVSTTIQVGSGPRSVVLSPDGTTGYTANSIDNSVTVFATATNTVTNTIGVGQFPRGIAMSPDGSTLLVTNQMDNSVSMIDVPSAAVLTNISVGSSPRAVAFSPDGSRAYVTNFSSSSVSVIDTATRAVIGSVSVGNRPAGLAVTPDGSTVYVANSFGSSVSVISTATRTVTTTVPVGASPQGVSVTPDGAKAYVANYTSNTVSVINTSTNTVITTIPVPTGPTTTTTSPIGNTAYSVNYGDGSLSVIDTSADTVTQTVPITIFVSSAAVGRDGSTAYVADLNNSYVTVVTGLPGHPGAPTGLTATPGDMHADLSFTAPANDGGSTVNYEYSLDGGTTWLPLTTNSSGSTVTGTVSALTNGTTYSVTVRAVNTFGTGSASGAASVTPAVPASPPGGVTGAVPGAVPITGHVAERSVALTFPAAEPNGSPVTGYESSIDGGATWRALDVTADGDRLRATVADLDTGTTYRVFVRAVNAAGEGPASNELSITPGRGLALRAPSLRGLRVGDNVDTRLTASGGRSPYHFAVTSGRLPVGLTLGETTGRLSGRPTSAGTTTAAITVTDSATSPDRKAVRLSATVGRATAATLPDIDRSSLTRIPEHPAAYRGRMKLTRAWRSSHSGIDAYPAIRLTKRDLIHGQAATLAGDGLFTFDSAKLTDQGRAQIHILATALREARSIRCEGYTDYAGRRSHELDLSRRRAAAVCSAIRAAGANVTVNSLGYGPQRPAVIGGTAKARRENRRVVVLVRH